MIAIDTETIGREFGVFRQRLVELRRAAPEQPERTLTATLAELEVAEEELQVCLEEIHSNREAVADRDSDEWLLLTKVFTELPVPVFVLTTQGSIHRCNAAAAGFVGAPQEYLSRRPLAGLIDLDSRAGYRTRLSAVIRDGGTSMVPVHLSPRYGNRATTIALRRITVRDDTPRMVIAVAQQATGRPGGNRRQAVIDTAGRADEDLNAANARIAHLGKALDSRTVIGQAMGIIMARRGLSADQAFHTLSRASQNHNVKLVRLAQLLVSDPANDHGI